MSTENLPVLAVGVPVLCRSPGRVQVGHDPACSVLLTPPPGHLAAELAGLIGELRRPQTLQSLRRRIRSCGLTITEFRQLLDRLLAAGQVTRQPRPDGARLRPAIHGDGRLAMLLAEGLTELGLEATGFDASPGCRELPNLVVLAGGPVADPALTTRLLRARIAHLPVHVHDGVGSIGPLVLPGLSSCLRCHDLFRTADHPDWPALAARLCAVPGHASAATVRATASLAAVAVEELSTLLAAPDAGRPLPALLGRALEFQPQAPKVVLRERPIHPACGCATRAPAERAA